MFLDELKKLKPGDRILCRWNAFSDGDSGFITKGYVLKITKRCLICKFPSHKKAKSIRKFWFSRDRALSLLDDELCGRVYLDVAAQVRKASDEKNEWYTRENKEYRKNQEAKRVRRKRRKAVPKK